MARTWYYVDRSDQEIGPVDAKEIRARVADGTISKTTMVWRDDLPDWVEAGRIRKLVAAMPGETPNAKQDRSASKQQSIQQQSTNDGAAGDGASSSDGRSADRRSSNGRRVARRALNLEGTDSDWDQLAKPEPIAGDDPFAFHDDDGQVIRSFGRPPAGSTSKRRKS